LQVQEKQVAGKNNLDTWFSIKVDPSIDQYLILYAIGEEKKMHIPLHFIPTTLFSFYSFFFFTHKTRNNRQGKQDKLFRHIPDKLQHTGQNFH